MGFSYAPATVQVRSGTERATLVRRTYGLVFLSVITTILGSAFAFSQPAVMDGVLQHPFITFICMFVPLIMAQRAARDFPKNLILTFLFTFIEGIWLAPFLMLADRNAPGVVGQAAVLTFAAFGVLSLYAVVSRRDFSAWGSFLMVGVFVLLVAMILNAFIGSAAGGLWIAAIGVMIFSGLLVFDTWRLLRSGAYGQDDYVLTAVAIYLDLLNMFVFILSLLGGGRRR
ncbi:MAG TPA: Bax inhibitor-1/YccA family protein [Gemmatimonadaceae bacterium]|jgi:FtsH-binding integral membrane protein|nr:Bax inhibitor-1/YccA family protein [Gemmatimonadaceae bacterium]